MTPLARLFALLTALVLAGHATEKVVAEPPLSSKEGVLVLRNGQILAGRITSLGDRYLVIMRGNAEVSLPVEQVERHCQSIEQAYFYKRDAVGADNAAAHLALAQWSLRHGLLARAADQLLAAIALEPEHPQVAAVHRRLVAAVHKRPARPGTANGQPHHAADDREQLEDLIRQLPPKTVETFTSVIQPLLLNRCATATCHGSSSQAQFKLLRPSWSRTLSRRFTQRNLAATLEMIDRQRPRASRLLTAPEQPHGTAEAAVFEQHELYQYQQLVKWVQQAAQEQLATRPTTISVPAPTLLQTAETERLRSQKREPETHTRKPPLPLSPAKLPDEAYAPKDPFDPELFNRRYQTAPPGPPPP